MDTNQNNTESNIQINTFTKGMNTDTAYDFMSNELYLFGKNIRITNNPILYGLDYLNNTNGVVAPVPVGETILFLFKDVEDINGTAEEGKVIGSITKGYWTSDDVDSILSVKTVDNIGAIILKYNDGKWKTFRATKTDDNIELTLVYLSTQSTDKPKFSVAINKETSELTKLYIADGIHSIMIINLTDENLSYYLGLTEDELSATNLYPSKAPVYVGKISGTLKTSQVHYAYRLYKKYGICSKMSPLSHKIQVISNSRSTDIGNEEDTQSSVGFRLRIDIDKNHAKLYDKIQLYRVLYIKYGEEPVCELIWDAKFDKSTTDSQYIKFFVSDNGMKALEEYTIDEFNQISGLSLVPLVIDYNQQYMFAADIKDNTIIKLSDDSLDMLAYQSTKDGVIRLYSDTSYNDLKSYTSLNDLYNRNTDKKYYIDKHTDMSLLDYFNHVYINLCIYIPKNNNDDTLSGILWGKGKYIEWRFVVRLTPIHENIYTEKPALGNYDSLGHYNRIYYGCDDWNPNFDRSEYKTDVPNVESTDNIYYKYIKKSDYYYNKLELVDPGDTAVLNDDYYLIQHLVDLNLSDKSKSYDNIFTSSMFRSLQRGETYRYGIVFYDKNGNRTDAKFIADIRVPLEKDLNLTEFSEDGKILYANQLGIQFIINKEALNETEFGSQFTQYEIVRCKKSPEYCKSLIQVATSRPLIQKQFTLDKGNEETYYPYYPGALLTTDPYLIGFKLNIHQGGDYASCSEVNNYHKNSNPEKHDLDFLQLFSPDIQYRREDTLDVLNGSNIFLHSVRFLHNNFNLNDYDTYIRCRNLYQLINIKGDKEFGNTDVFKLSNKGLTFPDNVINRCIHYGQCSCGSYYNNPRPSSKFKEDYPSVLLPNDEESNRCYILPSGYISSGKDGHENFTLPEEWRSDSDICSLINLYLSKYIYGRTDRTIYDHSCDSRYFEYVHSSAMNNGFNPSSEYCYTIAFASDVYLTYGYITEQSISKTIKRYRMYTPYPVINRAYLDNDSDNKLTETYVIKDYYTEYAQNYADNDFDTTKSKYKVLGNQEIQISAVSDVQNPLWEDGYDDVELKASLVQSAVKKYKTYVSSVGNKTYCNWSCGGLYNYRVGENDTVPRITSSYRTDDNKWTTDYSRILHMFNPSAEDSKGYHPGSWYWGDGTGNNNGANADYFTYHTNDLRWNNAWFGPGPVCFIAKLKENFGSMDFKYGQFMLKGCNYPLDITNNYTSAEDAFKAISTEHDEESHTTKYRHAHFSSFGTWVCNITHTALNFSGMTKQEKYYDSYVSFGNICDINESQCVFDGDVYILPCEFTTMYKTYNKNATSTLNSLQFVYYVPMESKVNVCFDYGMNYRNSKSPNLQLEPGDMEGVASQDRPLHLYNYIYSDNNNSIVNFVANYDEYETTEVPHRIVYSEPKTNGEDVDQWSIFRAANFIDADSHYGMITHLFTIKNILHFWQKRAFGRLTVNERSLVTDQNSNQITLGTGGVVQRTDYIDTNYGMLKYDMCAVNAENNVFWVDRTNNSIVTKYEDKAYSVGELIGVQNYINSHIDKNNIPTIHYDISTKEIAILCLKEDVSTLGVIEQLRRQLIYSMKAKVATSIYTRTYDDIIEFNNVLYSINKKNTNTTRYNFINTIDDNTEYLHPSKLSFLVNVANNTTKVFDNQKIVTAQRKIYDPDGSSVDYANSFLLNKLITFDTDIHTTLIKQNTKNCVTDREGNILYSIPRYGNADYGNRLVGKWLKVDIDMLLTYRSTPQTMLYKVDLDRPISQIITKFRRSYS